MSIHPARAIAAYSSPVRSVLPSDTLDLRAANEPSFTKMVEKAATEAIGISRAAEQQSFSAVAGKADLTDVVTSVANAEITLQSVMAIRDRVVTAYQEILRMPI